MKQSVLNLIEQLKSNDQDLIDEAIVIFADVFLIHNAVLPESQQRELLQEPYLSLRLTEAEQEEIINTLGVILISNPNRYFLMQILWVLSKVPARVGLNTLLHILQNCPDYIGDDEYFSVQNAFYKQLYVYEDSENEEHIRVIMSSKNPAYFYGRKLKSESPDIANSAKEALENLFEEFGLTE